MNKSKTVFEEGLVPASKVYVGFSGGGQYKLKEEMFSRISATDEGDATDMVVEGVAVVDEGKVDSKKSVEQCSGSGSGSSSSGSGGVKKKGQTREEKMLAKMMGGK